MTALPGSSIPSIGKQVGNSCGAYDLAAVGSKQGLFPDPIAKTPLKLAYNPVPTDSTKARSTTIDLTKKASDVADAIFTLTGNLDKTYTYTGAIDPDNTNSPSALAYVAQVLGLSVQVNVEKGSPVTQPPMDTLYKAEKNCINTQLSKVLLNEGVKYSSPSSGEAQLICVLEGGLPKHWVVLGDDGKYYDSRHASDTTSWDITKSKTTVSSGDKYEFSGLWITLK